MVATTEEDEVVQTKKKILKLRITIQTMIGKCPPKANRNKEDGKSTKGKAHRPRSQTSKVASRTQLNPKTRKIQKKQTPAVKITKFQRRRRKQERMTLRRPSNIRSIKHYKT